MSLEVVDKITLRDLMLRNKDFLARLYLAESVSIARKLIVNAESEQLCLLIHVLHYISNGSIPIKIIIMFARQKSMVSFSNLLEVLKTPTNC